MTIGGQWSGPSRLALVARFVADSRASGARRTLAAVRGPDTCGTRGRADTSTAYRPRSESSTQTSGDREQQRDHDKSPRPVSANRLSGDSSRSEKPAAFCRAASAKTRCSSEHGGDDEADVMLGPAGSSSVLRAEWNEGPNMSGRGRLS